MIPAMKITDEMRNVYTQGWRASEELLTELHRLLYTYTPVTILETGPGVSSVLFYQYQQLHHGTVYMSLNHSNNAHHKIFIDHMIELGFDTSMAFEVPVVDGYYDVKDIPADMKFDMLCLDGPPSTNDRASPAAMSFLKAHSHAGSVIIQDDTNRPPEAQVITDMCSYLGRSPDNVKVLRDSFYTYRTSTVLLPGE